MNRHNKQTMNSYARLRALGLVLLLSAQTTTVHAQSEAEINVEEIRSQLSASAKSAAATAPGSAGEDLLNQPLTAPSEFATEGTSAASVDNKELLAAEAALMKQLKVESQPVAQEAAAAGSDLTAAAAEAGFSIEPVVKSTSAKAPTTTTTTKQRDDLAPETKSESPELKRKLAKAETKVNSLTLELRKTRDRLMLAETEIDRLSKELELRNKNAMLTSRIAPVEPAREISPAQLRGAAKIAPPQQGLTAPTRTFDDVMVAVVTAEKANLRAGPGVENSPLMSVTRGTKLVVEERKGDWFRIITPTGSRAWVKNDVVAFNNAADPESNVRIRGFSSAIEANRHSSRDRLAF